MKQNALFALLFLVSGCLITSTYAQEEADSVLVTVPTVSARPGDRVLVPVQISGLDGREIVSGEVGLRFDPAFLTGEHTVRVGSLLENQRWLTGNAIDDSTSATSYTFRFVFAAALGFTRGGDLLFFAFTVDPAAVIGTETELELFIASFNNGSPPAKLKSGTLRVVEEVVEAGFVARPRVGEVPLDVRFFDRSIGTIETYLWNFGDGETSGEKNPTHVYALPESYAVSLKVTGPSGSNTVVQEDYILAQPDTTAPVVTRGPKAVDIKQNRASIRWRTNEASDSFVEYATNQDFSDAMSVRLADLVRKHRVQLTGLAPRTRYVYRVQSTDAAGNPSKFKRGFFRTKRSRDRKSPVIVKGPSDVGRRDRRVAIVLRTDEVCTLLLEYANTEDFADPTRVENDELEDEYRIWLDDLVPDTHYFYRAKLTDSDGNASDFNQGSFKTEAGPDGDAPGAILGPVAIGLDDRGATVKVQADEPFDIQVNYGTGTDYGLAEVGEERRAIQRVRLTNLEPSTLYHAQAVYTDPSGNSAISDDFVFVTRGQPDRKDPELTLRPSVVGRLKDRLIVQWESDEPGTGMVEYGADENYGETAYSEAEDRMHTAVLAGLDRNSEYHFQVSVTDLSGNEPVFSTDVTARTLAREAPPARVLQSPIVADRDVDRATIQWKTDWPADNFVVFGLDETYGQRAGTDALDTQHEVVLTGLEAAILYHFRVDGTDANGNEVRSDDFTFSTRTSADVLAPFITRGPEVPGVTHNSAFIDWCTNEQTDGLVEYGLDLNYGATVFQEDFTTDHNFTLSGLEPGTTYHFRVSSADVAGNSTATSGDVAFTTLTQKDMHPPAITAGPGIAESKADQVTIQWRTNEPADSFVDYGADTDYGQTEGGTVLTRRHAVTITGLESGVLYHYRARSTDAAGNTSSTDASGNQRWSGDRTFFTLQTADLALPVIVKAPIIIAGNRGALIRFTTDERCIARLTYGTASTLDTPDAEVFYETEARARHRLRIGHLVPRTRYLFRLTCTDAAGNQLEIGPPRRGAKVVPLAGAEDFFEALEFTTEEMEDTLPPVIVSGPTLISRTADSAIIEWTTDEPADSFVDFGTNELDRAIGDAEYTQVHRIVLTGLESSTAYSYQVRSTDFAGNAPITSQVLGFSTLTEADLTAPLLLTPPQLAYVDNGQTIIVWTTDETASPQMVYGAGEILDRVFFNEEFKTQHRTHLTSLAPGTTYRYQIGLTDPSGNGPATTEVLEFKTAAAADTQPPQLSPIAVEESDDSAIVIWTTDEPASGFVFYGETTALGGAAGEAELSTGHRVVLTNLTPGTTYHFQVESIDPIGNSSGRSALAQLTTRAGPDVEPPAMPAEFAALLGLEEAILSWPPIAAPDLASYTVYRQIRSGAFEAIATGLADTFYVDSGLSFGTPYAYYVTAVDRAGNESAPSSEDGGTPSILNVPGAVSPIGVEVTSKGATLRVSNAQPGQRGGPLTYTFHVSTSELFDDIVARGSSVEPGQSTTSWSFEKELEPGRNYFWRARAGDEVFDGPWSFPSFFAAPEKIANTGDFDNDGVVSFEDFFIFADAFGSRTGEPGFDEALDLNDNGQIDFVDFFVFVDFFGTEYASSHLVAADQISLPDLGARSHLEQGLVVVEITADESRQWRGVGLVVGFDPQVLERVEGNGPQTDFLRNVTGPHQLQAHIEIAEDAVALLAHRMGAAPFSGAGSVAALRFRPLNQDVEAQIEVRAGAVQRADGQVGSLERQVFALRLVPEQFALGQNFPNPFNPETTIAYDLPEKTRVQVEVFDVLGQKVRTLVDGEQAAGRYQVRWEGRDENGRNAASGIYFYRLHTDGFHSIRRMVLLR